MKKILLLFVLFLSIETQSKNKEATLILEYNYIDEGNQKSLIHLENDNEFCCYYELTKVHNDTLKYDIVRVIDKKSGICLGIMYGVPSKDFLMSLYESQLTPKSVEDIVTKVNEGKRN